MTDLEKLQHKSAELKNNGEVIVLDTGSVITAEDQAMIQALHSRSTGGLRSHLRKLAKVGSGNFMKNFYVGYGHKSIGDCGTTTMFVEGVSFLAAKAIQDFALYSGQEASTRYIDFSEQDFIDPTRTEPGGELLEMQRAFYLAAQTPTREMLREMHPRGDEDEKKYDKAINARTFDITRGLLPAGGATNLAWHANLRQAADRLLFLRHHPLPEVQEIALGLEDVLKQHHPHSFNHKKYPETEDYQDAIATHLFYHDPDSPENPLVDLSKIDRRTLNQFRDLIETVLQ